MCCLSKFKKVSERNTNDVDRSPSSKSAKDERDLIIICIFIFLKFLTEIEAYGACVTDCIYNIVLFLKGQKTLAC